MTYQGSEEHIENAKSAFKKATQIQQKRKEQRMAEYNLNPVLCQNEDCSEPIPYKSRNKYCSKSCAAKTNNQGRCHSTSTKKKISTKAKEVDRRGRVTGHCKVILVTCKICDKQFYQSITGPRVTCSRECHTIAATSGRTYQNGSRKPSWYFNKHQNKEVLLESSWEVTVATKLDELSIEWVRPKPIRWTDSTGKNRLYFPDFYLPHLGTYLDPKNPYCMQQDQEKLEQVKKKIDLVYGPLEDVLDFIQNKR